MKKIIFSGLTVICAFGLIAPEVSAWGRTSRSQGTVRQSSRTAATDDYSDVDLSDTNLWDESASDSASSDDPLAEESSFGSSEGLNDDFGGRYQTSLDENGGTSLEGDGNGTLLSDEEANDYKKNKKRKDKKKNKKDKKKKK